MSKIVDNIEKLKDKWFLFEPPLFMVLCSFPIKHTNETKNIMVGGRYIYVNDEFFEPLSDTTIEEYVKGECIRILLRHPFQRVMPNKMISYKSSNIVIGNNVKFKEVEFPTMEGSRSLAYEDIYNILSGENRDMKKEKGESAPAKGKGGSGESDNDEGEHSYEDDAMTEHGNSSAFDDEDSYNNTKFWDQDEVSNSLVGKIVDKCNSGKDWGTLSNGLISRILADDPPVYNYKTAIRRFKRNIVSSDVCLTRMKPNRRYGYEQMGRKSKYTANLLLVCDTSGSMSDAEISKFCGFVNGFFSCGMASIDCIQFDTIVHDSTLRPIHRKIGEITTKSRGGTIVDDIPQYVNRRAPKKYSGVVVFTDGGFHYDPEYWSRNMNGVRYLFCVTEESMFTTLKGKAVSGMEVSKIEL